MYFALLLICACSYLEAYRYNDRPFERWSPSFLNEEAQKRGYEGMNHHDNYDRQQSMDSDPQRFFNPEMMETPRKRQSTASGPEAESYLSAPPAHSADNSVSPQERLARLISKPIYDGGDNVESAGDDNEVTRRMETQGQNEEDRAGLEQQQEQGERRSYFHSSWHSPHFYNQHHGRQQDEVENRNLYREIRPFIKKSKIAKRSALIKSSKKGKQKKLKRSLKKTLMPSKTKTSSKNSSITARNEVSSAGDLVPGSTGEEFGTQFAEPFHGSTNNGNSGYARGEYFGTDSADTQDDVKPSYEINSASIFHQPVARSFNDNGHVEDAAGKGEYLLDSERLDGIGGITWEDGHHATHHGPVSAHAESLPSPGSEAHRLMTDVEEFAADHHRPVGLPYGGESDVNIHHQQHVSLEDHHLDSLEHSNGRDHSNYFMDPHMVDAHGYAGLGYHEGPVGQAYTMDHGGVGPMHGGGVYGLNHGDVVGHDGFHGGMFGAHNDFGDVQRLGGSAMQHGGGFSSEHMHTMFGDGHGLNLHGHETPMFSMPTQQHHEMTPEQYGKHLDEVMQHYLPIEENLKSTHGGLSEKISPMALHAPAHPNQHPGYDIFALKSPWEGLQIPYQIPIANGPSGNPVMDDGKGGPYEQGGKGGPFEGTGKGGPMEGGKGGPMVEGGKGGPYEAGGKEGEAPIPPIGPPGVPGGMVLHGPEEEKQKKIKAEHLKAKLNSDKSDDKEKDSEKEEKKKEFDSDKSDKSDEKEKDAKKEEKKKKFDSDKPAEDESQVSSGEGTDDVKWLKQEVKDLKEKVKKMTADSGKKKSNHPQPAHKKNKEESETPEDEDDVGSGVLLSSTSSSSSTKPSSTTTSSYESSTKAPQSLSHHSKKNKHKKKTNTAVKPSENAYANLGFVTQAT